MRETGWRYLRVAIEIAEVRDGVPVSFRKTVAVVRSRGADDLVVESEGVTILIDSLSANFFAGAGEVLDWKGTADGRAGFTFRSPQDG